MSEPAADQLVLDPVDQRVLGSLLEKERTVPDTYPLTLNALRSACNQTTGRDPVLALEDHELTSSIDRLKALGLARIVHAGAGARATRYRQVADERLGLDDAERAVLTLLLLRGPQTPGELRSRSDRLHPFGGLDEVADALARLRERAPAFVRELERQPGQKERRWTHLLGPTHPAAAAPTDGARGVPPPPAPGSGPRTGEDDPTARVLADGAAARDARVVTTYDAVAAAYAGQGLDAVDEKPFDRWLLERLAADAGTAPIADVGCGPGATTAFVAMAAAGPVTGYDLSPGAVAEARRRFPEVAFEVADLRALPGPTDPDGWGLVLAWYALVHLAEAELADAVAALASPLRPGGRLAVAVHVGSGVVHLDEWCGAPVDVDFVLHDPDAVLAAVRAAGLADLEWYRRGPLPVEAETERLYVVARRPSRQAQTGERHGR